MTIDLTVILQTDQGLVEITSSATQTGVLADLSFSGDFLTYPDLRVKQFILDIDDGTPVQRVYEATASTTMNLSYAEILDITAATTLTPLTGDAQEAHHDPNKVLVSDVNRPLSLRADRVIPNVGAGPGDRVHALVPIGFPLSEGQFGQYPVVALCQRSRWALEVGQGDIAFAGTSVLDVERGVLGRSAWCNIGGQIAFAATDGIYITANGIDIRRISDPIAGNIGKYLGPDTSLGYLTESSNAMMGRRELWVAVDEQFDSEQVVYVFSLTHGRWTTLTRKRSFLVRRHDESDLAAYDSPLFGVISADNGIQKLVRETGGTDTVAFSIRTSVLQMGMTRGVQPWQLKRLYEMHLEAEGEYSAFDMELFEEDYEAGVIALTEDSISMLNDSDVPTAYPTRFEWSARGPYLSFSGSSDDFDGAYIDGFTLKWQPRYLHRVPPHTDAPGAGVSFTIEAVQGKELDCEGYPGVLQFVWATTRRASSKVYYGISSGVYTNTITEADLVYGHSLQGPIISLATKHYFKVESTRDGVTVTSDEYVICTGDELIIFDDSHFLDASLETAIPETLSAEITDMLNVEVGTHDTEVIDPNLAPDAELAVTEAMAKIEDISVLFAQLQENGGNRSDDVNSYTLTENGTVPRADWETGVDYAASFPDTAGDYLSTTGAAAMIVPGTTDLWGKCHIDTDLSSVGQFIRIFRAGAKIQLQLRLQTDGAIDVDLHDSTDNYRTVTGPSGMLVNGTKHLVQYYVDSSEKKVYIKVDSGSVVEYDFSSYTLSTGATTSINFGQYSPCDMRDVWLSSGYVPTSDDLDTVKNAGLLAWSAFKELRTGDADKPGRQEVSATVTDMFNTNVTAVLKT